MLLDGFSRSIAPKPSLASVILPALSKVREVVALDLPGHGETPATSSSGTFRGLADSVETYPEERYYAMLEEPAMAA